MTAFHLDSLDADGSRRVPENTPQEIAVTDHVFLGALFARGSQIYKRTDGGWEFVRPSADLFADPGDGADMTVGKHLGVLNADTGKFAPNWRQTGGPGEDSGIEAKRLDPDAPAPDPTADIKWLRLQVVGLPYGSGPDNNGLGLFAAVKFVQRIKTEGGQPPPAVNPDPAEPPPAAGAEVPVDYRAWYQFWGDTPAVTKIDPSSGAAVGGTTVTITGKGLAGVTDVGFGETSAVDLKVMSDTELTVVAPAGAGDVKISLFSPLVPNPVTAADQFTYLSKPVVTGVDPGSGDPAGSTTVTISGSGFSGAFNVGFGDTTAPDMKPDSDIRVTAVSPPGEGTVSVTVSTPAGSSDPSSAAEYTYEAAARPAPAVTAVDPGSGDPAGGTTVTITGTGLMGATEVRFGATSVSELGSDTDTQITVQTPPGTGAVDVTVTTPVGTSATSDAARFDFGAVAQTALVVSGIDPSSGDAAGGTLVRITGSGLSAATDVVFDMASASELTVIDDTAITVVSPAGAGNVPVTVRTADTSSTNEFAFQYQEQAPAEDPTSPSAPDPGSPGPSDPAPTDPPAGDQGGPVAQDPAPTDPAPTDPAPTDPPTGDQGGPVAQDPAPTDPAPTDSPPTDPPAGDQGGPVAQDPATADPAPTDPSAGDQGGPVAPDTGAEPPAG